MTLIVGRDSVVVNLNRRARDRLKDVASEEAAVQGREQKRRRLAGDARHRERRARRASRARQPGAPRPSSRHCGAPGACAPSSHFSTWDSSRLRTLTALTIDLAAQVGVQTFLKI